LPTGTSLRRRYVAQRKMTSTTDFHGLTRIVLREKNPESDLCPSVKIRGGNKPIAMAMKGKPGKALL
jgi:hypothetical protein